MPREWRAGVYSGRRRRKSAANFLLLLGAWTSQQVSQKIGGTIDAAVEICISRVARHGLVSRRIPALSLQVLCHASSSLSFRHRD